MTEASLLAEFQGVDTSEWERIIREDLKGADYARSLMWLPEAGLAIKPYYRAEDLDGVAHLDAAPGESPGTREMKDTGVWRICEGVDVADPVEANRIACEAISQGAQEIAFSNLTVANASSLVSAIANLDGIPVCFENADRQLIRLLMDGLHQKPRAAQFSTGFDPLRNLDFAAEVLADRPAGFVPFSIRAAKFHEHGAGSAEEIGLALAAGVDFLAAMEDHGLAIDQAADSLTFSFAIGPEFFLQIAKLRAFRLVWAQAVHSFGGPPAMSAARIQARTAGWNQTIYDRHVNILRAGTEAMSAVLGGADSIQIAGFDACCGSAGEMSRRLARNTQLILKHEADLARVADPGAGSYCLEVLTDAIAHQSWQMLQRIESEGGYRNAIATGVVDSLLTQRGDQRARGVACRKRVLTGTNHFADPFESALSRIEDAAQIKTGRAAEPFERLRMRTERHAARIGRKPRILLAESGEDRKLQGARSNFAADFLACAGLESRIVRVQHAEDIADHDADLVVLCSADAEYLSIVSALFGQPKTNHRTAPVVVAGLPETASELRALGVADFIHVRCNAVETLANIQRLAGIKD